MITERVPTGRRGPLAVGLIALALVALLAWKPWDRPTSASPSPSLVAVSPTSSPTAPPTPSPPPPTPDLPASSSPSPEPPVPTPTPTLIVGLTLTATSQAFVNCGYGAGGVHGGLVLTELEVAAPFVRLSAPAADSGIRQVSWRVELQTNDLAEVFSADWQMLKQTHRQFAPDLAAYPLAFVPRHVVLEQSAQPSPTAVVRVVIIVEWFGAHGRLVGSESVVPNRYSLGGPGVVPEGCHAIM